MQLTEDLGKEVWGSSLSLWSWDCCGLLSCGLATYLCEPHSQVLCRRTLSESSCGFSSLLPPFSGMKSLLGLFVQILWQCGHTHQQKSSHCFIFCVMVTIRSRGCVCVIRTQNKKFDRCSMLSHLAGQVWHLLCSLLAWERHEGVTPGFCSVLRMETWIHNCTCLTLSDFKDIIQA